MEEEAPANYLYDPELCEVHGLNNVKVSLHPMMDVNAVSVCLSKCLRVSSTVDAACANVGDVVASCPVARGLQAPEASVQLARHILRLLKLDKRTLLQDEQGTAPKKPKRWGDCTQALEDLTELVPDSFGPNQPCIFDFPAESGKPKFTSDSAARQCVQQRVQDGIYGKALPDFVASKWTDLLPLLSRTLLGILLFTASGGLHFQCLRCRYDEDEIHEAPEAMTVRLILMGPSKVEEMVSFFPKVFQTVPQVFQKVPTMFQQVPKVFQTVPNVFQTVSQKVPKVFEKVFQKAPAPARPT